MSRMSDWSLALLGLLFFLAPVPGAAQDRPKFDDEVLQITPAVAARFITAATTEVEQRESLYAADPRLAAAAKQAACLRRHEASLDEVWDLAEDEATEAYNEIVDRMWSECAPGERPEAGNAADAEAWMTCAAAFQAGLPERIQAWQAAQAAGNAAEAQQLLSSLQNVQREMEAECGPEPEDEDFQEYQGLPDPPEDPFQDSEVQEAAWEVEEAAEARAAKAGGFTTRQYGVVRERVVAFLIRSLEDNRVRKYLFTQDEARALEQERTRLARLIEALDLL